MDMAEAQVIPIRPSSSDQKATLIVEALKALREAHVLDERDADLDTDSLVAWYDATIPDVHDIQVLASAMVIELRRRRGVIVDGEGERRGGNQSKVTHRVTLPEAERKQRSEDRALAEEPEAVRDYVKREVKSGRKPGVKGAVKAARKARKAKSPKKAKTPKTPTLPGVPALTRTSYSFVVRSEIRERVTLVLGKTLTLDELAKHWKVHSDIARRYLREVALLAEVVKDGDQYTVTGWSDIEAFKHNMAVELERRRQEARDGYNAWRPDNVHTFNQSKTMDWIYEQFVENTPEVQ
jgi:hypothetical protein